MKKKILLPWKFVKFKAMPGGKWVRYFIEEVEYSSIAVHITFTDRWYWVILNVPSRGYFKTAEEAMLDCDRELKSRKYRFVTDKQAVML